MRERRAGVFELRAYVGYDAATGKRRRLHATFKGTRRGAEHALAKLVRQADAAAGRVEGLVRRPQVAASLTLGEACERWYAWAAPRFEPDGLVTARENLDRYIRPRLGDVELWRLRGYVPTGPGDPDHDPDLVNLTDFYTGLEAHGGACRCPDRRQPGHAQPCPRGAPLAPSTVRRVHATLRTALKFAVAQSWVAANPAAEARRSPVPRRRATTPNPADFVAFLGFLARDNPELLAFVHVMNSGSRRVDGLGLRWDEVDFDARQLVLGERGVVRARDEDGRSVTVVRETATVKRRRRRVTMSAAATAAIRAHRQRCVEQALRAGTSLSVNAYVFSPDPDGTRPRPPSWASTSWRRSRSRAIRDLGLAGLARVRLYDVRHFFATRLLAAGIKEVEIAQLMGNSPATMRYHYASAISPAGREAADAMDQILSDAEQPRRPSLKLDHPARNSSDPALQDSAPSPLDVTSFEGSA